MADDCNNIKDLLRYATNKLSSAGIDTPLSDSQILLCDMLEIKRIDIIAHPETQVSAEDFQQFKSIVDRRASREPISYITGYKYFYGLKFEIDKYVLIPRPETELLVETAIDIIQHLENPIIADIGCGSGIISVCIAKHILDSGVYAIDISENALRTAHKNAVNMQVDDKIKFIKGNLVDPINHLKFDMIVSNPPYIPSATINTLQPEVSIYEPKIALDGGIDGLDIYKELVSKSINILNDKGILMVEIGIFQSETVASIFKNAGFNNIIILNDYSEIPRVVYGRK